MATPPPDPVPAWVDRVGYPFTNRFAELPAGRVHYVDEGTGEPILFVHGTVPVDPGALPPSRGIAADNSLRALGEREIAKRIRLPTRHPRPRCRGSSQFLSTAQSKAEEP